MTTTSHIRPDLFEFFTELRLNNNREWFLANKNRYQVTVRDPLLRFIADFSFHLGKISPHFVADPRPVGGSLFRIYRDTRFSKDKTPYKTAAGIQFRHERGRDVHAPGFYLHLEPKDVFAAMGLWHPDSQSLRRIRNAILRDSDRWLAVKSASRIQGSFHFGGESLKRAPKGFDPDHPLIEDLKRKDFVIFEPLSESETCRAGFVERFAEICSGGSGFMEFLTSAVGLEW
jgi:uncharacterized protein (TIGR02453 family)